MVTLWKSSRWPSRTAKMFPCRDFFLKTWLKDFILFFRIYWNILMCIHAGILAIPYKYYHFHFPYSPVAEALAGVGALIWGAWVCGRGATRLGAFPWQCNQPISVRGHEQRPWRCQLISPEAVRWQEFADLSVLKKFCAACAFFQPVCRCFHGWEAVQSSAVFWDCTALIPTIPAWTITNQPGALWTNATSMSLLYL